MNCLTKLADTCHAMDGDEAQAVHIAQVALYHSLVPKAFRTLLWLRTPALADHEAIAMVRRETANSPLSHGTSLHCRVYMLPTGAELCTNISHAP